MSMTNRQLIEHLAQHEPDMPVRLRDPDNPSVLHELPDHAVDVVEFVDNPEGLTSAELVKKLVSGEIETQMVVALG